MLETTNLEKRYKDKTVVKDLNLYLDKGESVGLLGPNGAGKSTSISMIASLLAPTSGDVLLHGQSVLKRPSAIRQVLGVVPQEVALYEELSAYENLKFFGQTYRLSGASLELKIQETLELIGLRERQKEAIKTYSGGMKRRVNIGASLLHDPELIIMDEPTVGIDPQSRNHILETVRLLNREKGMTVLYTSHYMEEVEQLCSRMYIMDGGRVIASGSKRELQRILTGDDLMQIQLDKPGSLLAEELRKLAAVRQVKETGSGLSVVFTKQDRLLTEVVQAAERLGIHVVSVHVQSPSLEDVFLHLTGRTLRD